MDRDRDGGAGPPDEAILQEGVVSAQDLSPPSQELLPSQPGRTLLPTPFAKAVSFATRSTGLALRIGTVLGSYGFGAAKITTLSSLELGRGILEGILSRAGKDAITRSRSELGRADAETVLERSLENLHRAMSQIVFWTTTGFHLTSTTLSTISELSQLMLSFLDSFLGSTESSRAIASIITLIRREFNNPATGQPGEKVGVVDLIVGLCGLAYLQRWSWRLLEEESHKLEVDEIIWDVVVLSDGERVDIHEDSLYGVHRGRYGTPENSDDVALLDKETSDRLLASIQRHGAYDSSDNEADLPEIQLKRHLMQALPANTRVAISTETSTTKIITVDIVGSQPRNVAPPPGVELVEATKLNSPGLVVQTPASTQTTVRGPIYRVVYRVKKSNLRSTEMQKEVDVDDTPGFVEQINDTDEDTAVDADVAVSDDEMGQSAPPLPPKPDTAQPRVSSLEQLESLGEAAFTKATAHGGQPPTPPTTASPPVSRRPSTIPLPKQSPETSANQKRPRMPVTSPSSSSSLDGPRKRQQSMAKLITKRSKNDTPPLEKPAEKKGGFRNALKKGSGSALSSLVHKDTSAPVAGSSAKGRQSPHNAASSGTGRITSQASQPKPPAPKPQFSVPGRASSLVPKREAPHAPSGNASRSLTARALAEYEGGGPFPRSPSRASYISIHERRRDSLVSQTDTYSIHSADNFRPVSPTFIRADIRAQTASGKSRNNREVPEQKLSPTKARRARGHLQTPSIYTLKTTDSQSSLVPYLPRSAYNDAEALSTLRRTGTLDSMFPRFHLLRNIIRYMRFSSASYGSRFLKVLGISKAMPVRRKVDSTHQELRSFAHHTESDTNSILLSSFVDPQGGTDSSGSTGTGVPLVHYVSLDDESKAVVLACRGTLGFEDILADMTCDYDDLVWRGKPYKVHKGVHASARRLLYGGDGRVLATIKAALEENPGYGLVLCGHSLGGAVTALLGVMLSEPAAGSTYFVTSDEPHSHLLTNGEHGEASSHITLPPGRPIHVYAYGPPATMSASLRTATRGLITSVVHGNDLVPYLSLGTLHDFQAVALAFKTDNNEAKQEVRQRIWEAFQSGLAEKWYNTAPKTAPAQDEQWAFAAFKTLRASMLSHKLLPPGEVFVVEATRVLRRDAFLRPGPDREEHLGQPAKRIVLKYVRDVETRFREVRFGTSMLTDHSPANYEDALNGLKFGVIEA